MSQVPPTASSSSSPPSSPFQSAFNAALQAYENKTKNNLLTHPLAAQLQSCDSPSAILSVLQDLIQQFDQRRRNDRRLSSWLDPTVNVVYALSATLSEGVGLVFSPAKVVFAGIGVLLLTAKDVGASQDVLVDIFERIENCFKRLESYTELPPSEAMTDMTVKIIVEILSILAIVTKEIKQRRRKKYLKKLLGRNDVEDALKRLDKLTQEESRTTTAEVLKVSHKALDVGQAANENQLRQDLRKWLSPPDPSTNHNIARRAHHEGTANWFFQGTMFETGKSTPSLLWVHGKPGSGKSVLCSGIIEDIMTLREAGSACLLYFYCDFRDEDKQNRRNILLSILSQLADQSDPSCHILSRLHSTHDNGARKPSDDTLAQCLKEILSIPNQNPVYIVIDGLDECPNNSGMPTPREDALDLIEHLVGLHLPNLHICVTSRPEIDIQMSLKPLTSLRISLHNQSGQTKDIVDYVSSVVHSDKKMRRWRDDDKMLVIETLSERADGMFRWVYCQLEMLRHCLPPSVRVILEQLPETLDETYERVLRDINKANREHALRLLHCLTVAIRPLRVEELAEVLAVDFDGTGLDGIPRLNPNWRWADQHQAVLSTCSSLIAIVDDGFSQVVQFSHFSVKEFLTSDRLAGSSGDVSRYHIVLDSAHTILAQASLGVLLQLDEHVDEDKAKDIPLAEYAALHWTEHARFEKVSARIWVAMEYLFDGDKPHFSAWLRVHDVDEDWPGFSPMGTPSARPLYYASLCGLHDLAKHLAVQRPEHVDAREGQMVTPLVAALHGKHFEIAELLFRHGADIDVRGRYERTLLHKASMAGLVDIMRWLLNHGADVNAHESHGNGLWTPLHLAVYNGQLEAARILLEHNADVNAQNDSGEVPFHLVAMVDDTRYLPEMIQLLLDHGADMSARANDGWTALHYSSSSNKLGHRNTNGTIEGTRLLLKHGASIDAEDNKGKTPRQVALEAGQDEIAEFLLGCGAK